MALRTAPCSDPPLELRATPRKTLAGYSPYIAAVRDQLLRADLQTTGNFFATIDLRGHRVSVLILLVLPILRVAKRKGKYERKKTVDRHSFAATRNCITLKDLSTTLIKKWVVFHVSSTVLSFRSFPMTASETFPQKEEQSLKNPLAAAHCHDPNDMYTLVSITRAF